MLPRGAFLVNVARARSSTSRLVEALRSGHLAGAALDVSPRSRCPGEPPWEMPNVLVSPHSASTSDRENARIVDLFCRHLPGSWPARRAQLLDVERMY